MQLTTKALLALLATTLLSLLAFGGLASAAQDSVDPEPAPSYIQINVTHRSDLDSKMHFSGGPVTLTARFSCNEAQMSYEVSIEVDSGAKSRREATQCLADAMRKAAGLPPGDETKIKNAGGTITVSDAAPGGDMGTPDKPLEHPNSGGSVNTNRPRSTQFQSN